MAPKSVAHKLGLQPRAIYKAIESGELRAYRFRGRLRIHQDDLGLYIERCMV
jgi:excisionase family DNA binding protein